MRILIISDFYPPLLGGLEQHASTLASKLAERGHDVAVATTNAVTGTDTCASAGTPLPVAASEAAHGLQRRTGPGRPAGRAGPRIYRVGHALSRIKGAFSDSRYRVVPPLADPVLVSGLKKAVDRFRPDVVHAHGWIMFSAAKLRQSCGVPTVVTLHDYGFLCPKRTLFVLKTGKLCPLLGAEGEGHDLRLSRHCIQCSREIYSPAKAVTISAALSLSRPLLDHVDRFIAVSRYLEGIARRAQIDRTVTVPNFIDAADVASAEGSAQAGDGQDAVYVGSMMPNKGIHVLLEAYRDLAGRGCRARLAVVGKTHPSYPYERALPDGVTIIRDAPHSLAVASMARSKFLVVPSISPEPFGIVALEAMALRKPVIASRIGGLPEIVDDGRSGILFAPGDARSLADAMEYMANSAGDRLREMGEQGHRDLLERYDTGAVIPQIERIYEDCS